jgi:hypothetical protein
MAQNKSKSKGVRLRSFNVTYEDGTLSSNRRVPVEQLDQSFGDNLLDLALAAIKAQDGVIAERSKQRPIKIKSIVEA